MYSTPPDNNKLYQGDIIQNGSFYMPAKVDPNNSSGIKTPQIYSGKLMIMTQTCDIRDNDIVHVCRVLSSADFTQKLIEKGKTMEQISGVLGLLRSKKTHWKEKSLFNWFYLPEKDDLEESIAILDSNGMVNLDELLIEDRVAYLSDRARHWLQYYLMRLWGRPFYWEEN